MNRSILSLLGIGIAGCIMLAVMLQHVLKVQAEQVDRPVAVQQVEIAFGRSLQGQVQLSVEGELARRDVTAVLSVTPKPGRGNHLLAMDLGRSVWRSLGTERVLDRVEVVFEPAGERYMVPAPWFKGRKWRPGEPRRPQPRAAEPAAQDATPAVPKPAPAAGGR